jgi:fatty acid desaturase
MLPVGMAFAFIGVQLAVFGVYMGASFAPNHKGMPILPHDSKVDFLRRQVLTSRNIKGNWLMDTFMGGLNYQIEHHLFPNMPRPHLKQGERDRQGVLHVAQHPVHRDVTDAVVRHRDPVPQPRRTLSGRRPLRLPGLAQFGR